MCLDEAVPTACDFAGMQDLSSSALCLPLHQWTPESLPAVPSLTHQTYSLVSIDKFAVKYFFIETLAHANYRSDNIASVHATQANNLAMFSSAMALTKSRRTSFSIVNPF